MAVVSRTASAGAKTKTIKDLHIELTDLPERILLRSKAKTADKEWSDMLVLFGYRHPHRMEGNSVADVERNVSFSRLDGEAIDTAVVWPLDRVRCLRGCLPKGIRRTSVVLAKDSATGGSEPAEVDDLVVEWTT